MYERISSSDEKVVMVLDEKEMISLIVPFETHIFTCVTQVNNFLITGKELKP